MNQRQILNNILKYGIYNDKNYTLTKIVFSSYSHSMTIYTTSTNVSSDEVTVVTFVVITRSSSSNPKTEYCQPSSFQHHSASSAVHLPLLYLIAQRQVLKLKHSLSQPANLSSLASSGNSSSRSKTKHTKEVNLFETKNVN